MSQISILRRRPKKIFIIPSDFYPHSDGKTLACNFVKFGYSLGINLTVTFMTSMCRCFDITILLLSSLNKSFNNLLASGEVITQCSKFKPIKIFQKHVIFWPCFISAIDRPVMELVRHLKWHIQASLYAHISKFIGGKTLSVDDYIEWKPRLFLEGINDIEFLFKDRTINAWIYRHIKVVL